MLNIFCCFLFFETFNLTSLLIYFKNKNFLRNSVLYYSFYNLLDLFFLNLILCFGVDKEIEYFLKDITITLIINSTIFIVTSIVIFLNEEFTTALSEVFFEVSFVTWVFSYLPDFLIFGINCFNNKISLSSSKLSCAFLPIIEVISSFLKSIILSVRLNTNFISGHLLLSIFFLLFDFLVLSNYYWFAIFSFFFISLMYSLEVLLLFLQIYVLLMLIIIYIKELQY